MHPPLSVIMSSLILFLFSAYCIMILAASERSSDDAEQRAKASRIVERERQRLAELRDKVRLIRRKRLRSKSRLEEDDEETKSNRRMSPDEVRMMRPEIV